MRNPLLTAAAGILLLCLMDAVIKHLSVAAAVPVALCLNYVARLPFAATHWLVRGAKPISWPILRYHGLRGIIVAFAALGFFIGVDRLPLAEAVTLSFVAPLLIPFFAWALLGERPRRGSLVAGAIGFTGVLVAVAGGGTGAAAAQADTVRAWGIAATLGGAALFALSLVLLRGRAAADGPARVNLLGSIVPALVLAPIALADGGGLGTGDWPWLIASGAFGAAGMALYAEAYGKAQAQNLAPLEYTALIWATVIGYALFAETPRSAVFAGAALIVAAGLLAARDERQARTAAAAPPLGD